MQPTADERNVLNGRTIPLEDYGSIKDDDRARIIAEEALEYSSSDADKTKQGKTSQINNTHPECYFRDGNRKIDYVLVYEEDIQSIEERKAGKTAKKDKGKLTDKDRHEFWREKFMDNLLKAGVQTEEESVENPKKMIYYIKLHIPWDILCIFAEDLLLRTPLQAHPTTTTNSSERILSVFKLPNMMKLDVPNKPLHYYTCPFKRSKINRFLGSDDHATFFPNRDRQRVAYEILAKTVYGKKKRAEIGIDRLLEEQVYTAAFPLHDGPVELPKHFTRPEKLNPRQILYEYWAKWGRWYKYQPLDHIREYFGEKISIYFAWIGFYTAWLLPASIVGLLVFLFGVGTMSLNTEALETCSSGQQYKMCPLCDETVGCGYWFLSDVCMYTKIAYLFDHPGTVFYSIFMSFWAVTFLEYWKRKTADLAHHWDCLDFQDEEERPRPEYAAKCTTFEKNPITGIKEPYFPKRDRIPRIISGLGVIILMMCLVIIFIIAVIMYRVLITIPLFRNTDGVLRTQASTVAGISASFVNLIIIMALSKVYEKLALKLTQWEMHRTQSEFEDQLIFKVFIFQFVNFYSSIIYIGFFKGKFSGYPGNYSKMLGLRQEECQAGSCLIELAQQLAVIMIGKQAINNCQELVLPKVKGFIHKWKIGKTETHMEKTRWEEEYEMIENEGLFEEYLEMVLQFGFITIFVAAFPLAPLFALLNNWMEIRLDAHKFVCETRRPVAERCQNIGVWFTILDALAQLAVISNAFLIAFTSEFLPKQLYKYKYNTNLDGYVNFTLAWAPNSTLRETCRYKDFRDDDGNRTEFYWQLLCIRLGFVIIFEHVVFGICRLIDVSVPDIPESLDVKIKRERYLAKQALADADTLMLVCDDAEQEDEDAEGKVAATAGDPTTSIEASSGV